MPSAIRSIVSQFARRVPGGFREVRSALLPSYSHWVVVADEGRRRLGVLVYCGSIDREASPYVFRGVIASRSSLLGYSRRTAMRLGSERAHPTRSAMRRSRTHWTLLVEMFGVFVRFLGTPDLKLLRCTTTIAWTVQPKWRRWWRCERRFANGRQGAVQGSRSATAP